MKDRVFWIVFCCLFFILGLFVWNLQRTSNELDALKAMPPKTIIEFVTKEVIIKESLPCPSEALASIIVTPYGPLVVHIRPGDIDRAIELKHEAIKDVERQRMENQGPKPIPKAPISNNGIEKRMAENL